MGLELFCKWLRAFILAALKRLSRLGTHSYEWEVGSYLLCLAYLPLTCPLPSHPGVGQLQTREIINTRLTSHMRTQTHTYARSCWLCSNRGTSAFITDLESSQCPPGRWLTRLHISYFILYIALWLLHLGPQPVKSHEGKHPSFELLPRSSSGSEHTSILVINIKLPTLVTVSLIA